MSVIGQGSGWSHIVVTRIFWQPAYCGDPHIVVNRILWWHAYCGDPHILATRILWWPEYCGDPHIVVTRILWWPAYCGKYPKSQWYLLTVPSYYQSGVSLSPATTIPDITVSLSSPRSPPHSAAWRQTVSRRHQKQFNFRFSSNFSFWVFMCRIQKVFQKWKLVKWPSSFSKVHFCRNYMDDTFLIFSSRVINLCRRPQGLNFLDF